MWLLCWCSGRACHKPTIGLRCHSALAVDGEGRGGCAHGSAVSTILDDLEDLRRGDDGGHGPTCSAAPSNNVDVISGHFQGSLCRNEPHYILAVTRCAAAPHWAWPAKAFVAALAMSPANSPTLALETSWFWRLAPKTVSNLRATGEVAAGVGGRW